MDMNGPELAGFEIWENGRKRREHVFAAWRFKDAFSVVDIAISQYHACF